MNRKCIACGAEYSMRSLHYDDGCCEKCAPGFFSKPAMLKQSPGGTRSVWQFVMGFHVLYLILFSVLLDGGVISGPVMIYSLTVIAYFLARFLIGYIKGFPVLKKIQIAGLLALPIYGPLLFIIIMVMTYSIGN